MDHVPDDVLAGNLGGLDAATTAGLRAIGGRRDRLDVPGRGHGDDDLIVGDQVLEAEVAVVGDEATAPVVAELLSDLRELVFDDLPPPGRVGEDRLEIGDPLVELRQFGTQLVDLERREPAKRHVEDGVRLDLGELEPLDQPAAGVGRVGRTADDRHDLVDVVDGDDEAFEDVGTGLGLIEPELRPALDDLHLVVEVVPDHLGDVQRPGNPVDQGDHVVADAVLKWGQLVELVEHHLGNGVLAQVDGQAGANPVRRLVAHLGDAGELLVLDQLLDPGDDPLDRHLVGQLGGDDRRPATAGLLDVTDGADLHGAAPGGQGLLGAGGPEQEAAGREVGALDELQQLLRRGVGVLDGVDGGVDDLGQVVGRDVGRHPDRDPLRTVDQQVREP